jgi:hypothetical protein
VPDGSVLGCSVILALSVTIVANASVESVWERRTISMAAQDNKEKARRLYEEAFGQGKTEVLDPNFVCWDPNAEGGEVRGLETVKGEVEYFHQGFPEDFFWRVEDQVVEGDKNNPLHYGRHSPRGVLWRFCYGQARGDKRDQHRPL